MDSVAVRRAGHKRHRFCRSPPRSVATILPSLAAPSSLRRVCLEIGGEEAARFVDCGVVAGRGALERDVEESIPGLEGKPDDELRGIGADEVSFNEELPELLRP